MDVGNDPVDTPVDGESDGRDYDATTNLGPLNIRIYHDWRGRQLRRAGSQSQFGAALHSLLSSPSLLPLRRPGPSGALAGIGPVRRLGTMSKKVGVASDEWHGGLLYL